MKGHAILYSTAELAWIEQRKAMPRADLRDAFCAEFGRNVSVDQIKALCTRKGWKTGRTGQFAPGQRSWNKGKKCPPGKGGNHPNARRTQFKKGNMSGKAEALYKPIGTERLSKEGYVERKIHDGLPLQSRWRAVHLIRWEALHGAVPEGMCLKCLDGDKTNTDPANWKLIPRAMLPRLNGRYGRDFDHAPAEVKPTIMAIAELEHRARTIGGDD